MIRPLAKTNVMKLAVIGMGNRVSHMSRLMCEADPDIRIAAAADPVGEQLVRRRMDEWKIPHADETHVFDDAEELLRHAGDFDGLLIGTRCDLHAPMAVRAAATGLPLFLEKPVAISWEQVWALRDAFARREENVVVSFPLRLTVHVQTALQLIRDGRLGVINQVQAVNNVPYGGVYFGQWYRSYETTGGLWLQKATHDFDYINQLLGARPMTIAAMHSRLAYGGNMPPDLVCSQCDR